MNKLIKSNDVITIELLDLINLLFVFLISELISGSVLNLDFYTGFIIFFINYLKILFYYLYR